MIEFDYKLDYKNTLFRPNDNRYRIGRGEQGVLLVRPYTDVICRHWRFKTLKEARVSSQKILLYTTLLIVFFLFFKQILYTQLLAQERALGPDYSELINWVRNTINTINSKIKYEYNPYLVTIEGVFNPFIIFDKPLSNWYIKNFFYKNYLAGNKYGFSFIAESYVAGSPYLLIIVYSFYGYLSKKISFKKVSPVNSVVQITVILMMYKLFRSESYNFFRSIVWSYFIPLIIIQFFFHIIITF